MASELKGMVLRCERTGKLFFSSKDAEVHSDETGYKDFSQVSPEEPVWTCAETGKVCFNAEQMELHKRRVPEAKTFEQKTVADMQAEAEAEAAAGDGAPMETDDEVLLRQAGMSGKLARLQAKSAKKGDSAPSGPPVVTKESVDALTEMGFSQLRAEKALLATSNAGIEPAVNWLSEHLEDAGIDEPIAEPFETKTAEQVGADAAAAAAASSASQLTPAEKKAKLDAMLAKVRPRREIRARCTHQSAPARLRRRARRRRASMWSTRRSARRPGAWVDRHARLPVARLLRGRWSAVRARSVAGADACEPRAGGAAAQARPRGEGEGEARVRARAEGAARTGNRRQNIARPRTRSPVRVRRAAREG